MTATSSRAQVRAEITQEILDAAVEQAEAASSLPSGPQPRHKRPAT